MQTTVKVILRLGKISCRWRNWDHRVPDGGLLTRFPLDWHMKRRFLWFMAERVSHGRTIYSNPSRTAFHPSCRPAALYPCSGGSRSVISKEFYQSLISSLLGSLFSSTTFLALSAPRTGSRFTPLSSNCFGTSFGSNNPICTSTLAWSQ